MTIVEATRSVVGGIDTHSEVHVAAALDDVGGLLGAESFAANRAGYEALLTWLEGFGTVARVGVEGTGSYGAGHRPAHRSGRIEVVEVDRQNRQARRHAGKSDPLDAIEAARAALSAKASGRAKSRDGWVEALRVLLVAKRSARAARIKALTQMRQLTYSAPDELRSRLEGLSISEFVSAAQLLRPRRARAHADRGDEGHALVARPPGNRARGRDRRARRHDHPDRRDRTPRSSSRFVVSASTPPRPCWSPPATTPNDCAPKPRGPTCAACRPSRPRRARSPRHRLNRGGNRQANRALWHIVITRLASDSDTKAYMERRLKEGRSKREVIRVLKRYVAREVYRAIPRG